MPLRNRHVFVVSNVTDRPLHGDVVAAVCMRVCTSRARSGMLMHVDEVAAPRAFWDRRDTSGTGGEKKVSKACQVHEWMLTVRSRALYAQAPGCTKCVTLSRGSPSAAGVGLCQKARAKHDACRNV